MFVSDVHVLSAAYLMGLAAAAQIGPVNMMAIRRGLLGGWRHTLACGFGSVAGDLILFSLALLGGHYLLPDLSNPTLRTVLASVGGILLFPMGLYFLLRAVKKFPRIYSGNTKRADQSSVPTHPAADLAAGATLTVVNPLTLVYWVGVTSNWLPFAHSVFGWRAPGWGILMVAAGLMTWFTVLALVVRFTPQRIGPPFFRLADTILGLILLAFAGFCVMVVF
jgi:L-lysine exporter family protein LysE/ArgO